MAQTMGVNHVRDGIEPQSIIGADMSVIGLIGTAANANANLFPLDTPVEVRTNDTTLRAALGDTGTIVDALAGISSQLVTAAAKVVVVRVAHNASDDTVIANIVGNEANGTGMWAFLKAPQDIGLTPRLIIAPGYTSQYYTGMSEIALATQGDNLLSAPTVAVTGGGSDPGKVLPTVTAVLGTGDNADKVVSLTVTDPGKNLSGALTVAFSGGGSDPGKVLPTATATVGALANPICAAIPTILARLKAKFLPEGPSSSRQAAMDWIETLPRDVNIVHPLRQVAKVSVDGVIVNKPLSPYIIGLYVRRDSQFEGVPGRSIANQSVNGLVGVYPTIPLDITNDSSIGMTDIENHFGIVIRGDIGTDGSLTDGGFIFWGTDTMSQDTQWMFANVVRMRDYIEINQVKAIRNYLGRENLTLQTVEAIVNTMESELSNLRADRHIIDYRISFDEDLNTPEELRLGFITITFQAEEPAPLRKVTLRSRRYRDALTDMVQNIAVQIGSVTAA